MFIADNRFLQYSKFNPGPNSDIKFLGLDITTKYCNAALTRSREGKWGPIKKAKIQQKIFWSFFLKLNKIDHLLLSWIHLLFFRNTIDGSSADVKTLTSLIKLPQFTQKTVVFYQSVNFIWSTSFRPDCLI